MGEGVETLPPTAEAAAAEQTLTGGEFGNFLRPRCFIITRGARAGGEEKEGSQQVRGAGRPASAPPPALPGTAQAGSRQRQEGGAGRPACHSPGGAKGHSLSSGRGTQHTAAHRTGGRWWRVPAGRRAALVVRQEEHEGAGMRIRSAVPAAAAAAAQHNGQQQHLKNDNSSGSRRSEIGGGAEGRRPPPGGARADGAA